MNEGDLYNLSRFSMCAHNGTHIDAPAHFLRDGKTIDQLPADIWIGRCFIFRHEGDLSADDAETVLRKAAAADASERLLMAGNATVTPEAARVFAAAGIRLIGNESQSVGPVDAPMEVHLILLQAEVILLEGVVLDGVAEGPYLLSAAPLNLAGFEGAPGRACLIEL